MKNYKLAIGALIILVAVPILLSVINQPKKQPKTKPGKTEVWLDNKKLGQNEVLIASSQEETSQEYTHSFRKNIQLTPQKTLANVTVKTKIQESNQEDIQLFRKNQEITYDYRHNVSFGDTNNNGMIDEIAWLVPEVEEQTFKVNVDTVTQEPIASGSTWVEYRTDQGFKRTFWENDVNYYDQKTGRFKKINLTLIPAPDKAGYDYYNEKNGYQVFFKNYPSQNFAKYVYKGKSITYWFGNEVIGNLNNVHGYASGNKFIYEDIYPDIDLVYTLEPEKLVEEFVAKKYSDVKELTGFFKMSEGIDFAHQEDGSIQFFDQQTNEKLWLIPPPLMYEMDKSRVSYDVHFEITESNGVYRLKKVIEEAGQEWLKTAKYPLVIDALYSLTGPAKDAFTYMSGADTNYGTNADLAVCSNTTYLKKSFAHFDISSLPSGSDCTIGWMWWYQDYCVKGVYAGADNVYNVRRITQTWIESGTGSITWNNEPTVSGSVASTLDTTCTDGWKLAVVTSEIDAFFGGTTNYGWRVYDANGSQAADYSEERRYRSKEHTGTDYDPKLEVTYTMPNGQSCSADGDCTSGHCIDGYCCNTTCTTTCMACDVAGHLGTCYNIPNDTDPDNECDASWTSCDSNCVRRGPDGLCDGAAACDTNDATDNIDSAYVCTGSGSQTAVSSSNYCNTDEDCDDGDCSATKWYICCNGSGACRDPSDHTDAASDAITADEGYTINNDCTTNGTTLCGYSSWACNGNCQRTRDEYRCNVSQACSYDVGDEAENCASQTACSGGTCAAGVCNVVWAYCAAVGDNYYDTGGGLYCQGGCDGSNNCDWAMNCLGQLKFDGIKLDGVKVN